MIVTAGSLAALVGGCVLIAVGVAAPLDVAARVALATLGAGATIGALMPPEVRAFVRREVWSLFRLVASLVVMGGAIAVARDADSRWLAAGAAVIAVGAELAYILLDPKFRRWVKFLTVDQWRAIDGGIERDPARAGTWSWQVLVVLLVCAVSLTLQEYIGDRGAYERWFATRGARDSYFELKGFAWWSGWRVLGYVVIPVIAILCMPGERLRDYHLSLRGFTKHLWIYLLLFALVLPAVVVASTTESFRHTYPFYRLANRSQFDLWSWEALYAAQFVSLELFFRGFLLEGLRRALGANAIFVMLVPYCMIHFGKPMSETLGAIGAGLILGTLAMRTRSIWGGVLIHIGVATTMDVLALRGCPPMGSNRYC